MGTHDESQSSDFEVPQTEGKAFQEAVVTLPKLFSRQGPRTTFETDSLETYYKPIDSYEGRHRYDPEFEWEAKEERKVVRKIDYKICSWVCLMFFALYVYCRAEFPY